MWHHWVRCQACVGMQTDAQGGRKETLSSAPSATVSSATSAKLCVEREPHAPRRAGPPGVPRGERHAAAVTGRTTPAHHTGAPAAARCSKVPRSPVACGRICWRTASARAGVSVCGEACAVRRVCSSWSSSPCCQSPRARHSRPKSSYVEVERSLHLLT